MDPISTDERERIYISKLTRFANIFGGGTFLLFSGLGVIGPAASYLDISGIYSVYIGFILLFITFMPIEIYSVERSASNFWMDWDVKFIYMKFAYFMIAGGITSMALMIPTYSFFVGFHMDILLLSLFGMGILLSGAITFYLVSGYRKNEDSGKRFMMVKSNRRTLENALANALASLNLSSDRQWIGSMWIGHMGYRIVNHPIYYFIIPGLMSSILVMKPETAESKSKEREIEQAIAAYVGMP